MYDSMTFEKATQEWRNGDTDGEGDYTDLVVGLYWHCVHYHGGQGSERYAVQCQISEVYKPGPLENGPWCGLAQDIYDDLAEDLTGKRPEYPDNEDD